MIDSESVVYFDALLSQSLLFIGEFGSVRCL